MKCYRCNNILSDGDKVCSKCGSMVIRYSSTNKKVRRKIKQNINEYDYSNVAISLIITKLLSFIFAFYSIINLFIPWLLLSLIFSVIGYKKYKSGKSRGPHGEITWAPRGKSRGPHGEITWAPRGNHVGPTGKSRGPPGEITCALRGNHVGPQEIMSTSISVPTTVYGRN